MNKSWNKIHRHGDEIVKQDPNYDNFILSGPDFAFIRNPILLSTYIFE